MTIKFCTELNELEELITETDITPDRQLKNTHATPNDLVELIKDNDLNGVNIHISERHTDIVGCDISVSNFDNLETVLQTLGTETISNFGNQNNAFNIEYHFD